MTNSFSFSRFGSYAASEMGASLRQLLLTIGLSFGMAVVIYCVVGSQVLMDEASFQQALSALKMGQGITMFAAMIFILRNISTSFRPYHDPLSAPRVMLLPVAMSEKFTYAFLRNVILVPALLYGVWYLVKSLFVAIFDLSGLQQIEEQLLGSIQQDITAVIWERVSQVLTSICIVLLFFMCSVIFRSRQFLWAMIIMTVVILTISTAILLYSKYVIDGFSTMSSEDRNVLYVMQMNWITAILALIAVTMFCVSWRKFKRLQVR